MNVLANKAHKMDINKITELVFNLAKAYDKHKEGRIINDGWIITDVDFYNKYKNKIIVNHASIGQKKQTLYGEYTLKDNILHIETKKYYGIIKYNTNFIAIGLSETEYGLYINKMNMVAVNTKLIDNYDKLQSNPPEIKDIFKIIKWKITNKALQNIENNIE
jgi:hypothetical protein